MATMPETPVKRAARRTRGVRATAQRAVGRQEASKVTIRVQIVAPASRLAGQVQKCSGKVNGHVIIPPNGPL